MKTELTKEDKERYALWLANMKHNKDNKGRNSIAKLRLWATSGVASKLHKDKGTINFTVNDKINWRSSFIVPVWFNGNDYYTL